MAAVETRIGRMSGLYACAAAKAALTSLLTGQKITKVSIALPELGKAEFVICDCSLERGIAHCSVLVNDADDMGARNEIRIDATVSIKRKKGVVVEAGTGIATTAGSCPGKRACTSTIDRATFLAIRHELADVLDENECHRGVKVVLSAHHCESLRYSAESDPIVLTFGTCKLYTVPATKEKLVGFLNKAMQSGLKLVVMTQSSFDEQSAYRRYTLSRSQVVNMGNYVGFMVRQAALRFRKILVVGHPAKLLKVLLDCYNTHSQKSVSILPWLKRQAEKEFWCGPIVQASLNAAYTAEGVIACIPSEQRLKFFNPIATRIEAKLKMYARSPVDVGVVLVNTNCHCIGCGNQARYWEEVGCLRLR
jgi:cobalt-precorrin-5B (C1)-methyltransferase